MANNLTISAYTQRVVQAFDKNQPTRIVFHSLTGDALIISAATESFLSSLEGKSISRSVLKKNIDARSMPILDLLIEKKILVQTGLAEYENFRSYFPIIRGCISYINPQKGKTFLFQAWNNERKIHEIKEFTPSPEVLNFIDACDGEMKLAAVEKNLSKKWQLNLKGTKQKIRKIVLELTKFDLQLLKFSQKPYSELLASNEHYAFFHHALEEFSHSDKTLQIKASSHIKNIVDLKKFHQEHIQDAFHEFESVEVTVSHAFRSPSSALNGRSYAGAFFDEASRMGLIKKAYSILEVGGGTGIFARELLHRAHEKDSALAKSLSYKIIDLAPELQRSQKKITQKYANQMSFTLGSAEKLKVTSNSIDFLFSNEVVADLRTVLVDKKDLRSYSLKQKPANPIDLGKYYIKKFDLPHADADEKFFFNLGTAKYIEEIYRVLKPGRFAFLSEFGSITEYPKPTLHLNHDEYSIHWGQMAFLAKRLGFKKAEIIDLTSFIYFDPNHPMYIGDVHEIRHIFQIYNKELPSCLAYSRSEIEKISQCLPQAKISGMEFAPLHRGMHWGPSPFEFKVLLLEK